MFLWAPIPERFPRTGFARIFQKALLEKALVAVSPGIGFGPMGEGHVRFALIENFHRTRQATRSIKTLSWKRFKRWSGCPENPDQSPCGREILRGCRARILSCPRRVSSRDTLPVRGNSVGKSIEADLQILYLNTLALDLLDEFVEAARGAVAIGRVPPEKPGVIHPNPTKQCQAPGFLFDRGSRGLRGAAWTQWPHGSPVPLRAESCSACRKVKKRAIFG